MITIKKIAELAGVSQSTVSKALNDRSDVGFETKKRVLEIARELHFTPQAFGKALKKRMSENVGVLFCRDLHSISGNPFYSRVLEGIEAELALNNFNLILHIITETTPDELPKMVRERQVDGLILVGTFRDRYIRRILEENLKIVFLDPKENFDHHCQILIDNEHGAFQATQYLIDMGHRRIGFISGDLSRMSFRQRYNGYLKALNHSGIEPDETLVRAGGLENGYDHARSLLESNRMTSLFAANDINAIFAYKAIHEKGLKIPDDISIVGFDDIDLARMSTPPLTTIRVYKEELGSIAVRALIQQIRGGSARPVTTIMPTRLVARESVRNLKINIKSDANSHRIHHSERGRRWSPPSRIV